MMHTPQTGVEALRGKTWRDIPVSSRASLRRALIKKHGSLTNAANSLQVSYQHLSDAISGRRNVVNVIAAIQKDLGLTNVQVLELWPLLREWPRESRMVS